MPFPAHLVQTAPSHHAPRQNGPAMNLSFAPSKPLSALETLAEVSRQHMDLSGQRVPDKHPSHAQNHVSQAPLLDGVEEFLVDDRPDGSDMGMSEAMDMSSAPALPAMYQFHHSPSNSPHMGHMPLASSASMAQMAPSLVMAASAANELMPLTSGLSMDSEMQQNGNGMDGMHGKYYLAHSREEWPHLQPNSLDPLLQESREETQSKGMGRPIAMNPSTNTQTHFPQGYIMDPKPAKPKVRGRFSDSRRKEVQEVRKRGACIRCRMLKKPCSGENPCSTCHNVESARLWKQPCIRTRIADEFSLYSAGLHAVLSHHATNAAKGQIRLDPTPGRIEVSHFPDSGHFATFKPLKCQQSQGVQDTENDPVITAARASVDLEIIDTDEDISGKLEGYMSRMGPSFLESETSAFMKPTLQIASRMTSADPDQLLSKAMELWHLTCILTSRSLDLHISSNPSLAPTMAPATLSASDPNRTPMTRATHPLTHSLISQQILSATEKRAACLARLIMTDLEKRLLQRQQTSPFETFLVAVILLACAERMCWMFRSWEVEAQPTQSDATLTRHPKWPLDKPPAFFSQQGERFSDILNMVLKMRGVAPKPTLREADGVLVCNGPDDVVRIWYEGIGVSKQVLDQRASAGFVGVDGGEWEFKFVGKIIRGE
jgi:hypothetical protein